MNISILQASGNEKQASDNEIFDKRDSHLKHKFFYFSATFFSQIACTIFFPTITLQSKG